MARKAKKSRSHSGFLINNLSVEDARHILKSEGGELTAPHFAFQIVAIATISALTARAIVIGEATAWHLTLPMVAEYLTLLLVMPIAFLFAPHPGLKKDVIGAIRLIVILIIIAAIVVAVRTHQNQTHWRDQFSTDVRWLWQWIVGAHMHWPIAAAVVATLVAVPGRVRNLYEHGPPFVGVSLGCAMRVVVLLFGVCVLPIVAANWSRITEHGAWIVWGVLLVADGLALWMHWDIQRRLRKIDRS